MPDTPTIEDEIRALRGEVHDLRRVVRNIIIIGAVAFLALCYFITRADDAHGATRDAAGDREASAPESQPRSHGGPEGSAAGLATTAAAPSDALRIRVSPRPASRDEQRQPIASKNPTANEVGKVEARGQVLEVTAYCWTGSRTASGVWPDVGMAAGNDWPFGTRLRVEDIGIVTVTDRYGWGTQLDLYLGRGPECVADAEKFGRQHLHVSVVR